MNFFKEISAIIGVIILIVFVYVSYLYISYIDETFLTGTGYGFKVGISKSDTFNKAKEQFKDKTVYIIYPENSSGAGPFKKLSFDKQDKIIFTNKDTWKIYYGKNVWDSIELTFENDKLFSIYRRRQNFELP